MNYELLMNHASHHHPVEYTREEERQATVDSLNYRRRCKEVNREDANAKRKGSNHS